MKATPITPSGIPKGQSYWVNTTKDGYEPTYNHGIGSRQCFVDDLDRNGRPTRKTWMDLAMYKEDRK